MDNVYSRYSIPFPTPVTSEGVPMASERRIRVGIVQVASHGGKHVTINAIKQLLKTPRIEADVIVFPEYIMADPTGVDRWSIYSVSEELGGRWTRFFQKLAEEHGSYVVTTLFEKGEGEKAFNTSIAISPSGEIIGVYRKVHLFDALGYKESRVLAPGKSASEIFEIRGAKASMAVCFDLRFPELFRKYALEGAQMVFVPSAWYRGPYKEDMLRFLAMARAHENTFYVIVASNPGERFVARSMIVDPLGLVVIDAGFGEKYVEHEIDLEYLNHVREQLPVLKLRRPEVYGGLGG